jgi:hypothetical protein
LLGKVGNTHLRLQSGIKQRGVACETRRSDNVLAWPPPMSHKIIRHTHNRIVRIGPNIDHAVTFEVFRVSLITRWHELAQTHSTRIRSLELTHRQLGSIGKLQKNLEFFGKELGTARVIKREG